MIKVGDRVALYNTKSGRIAEDLEKEVVEEEEIYYTSFDGNFERDSNPILFPWMATVTRGDNVYVQYYVNQGFILVGFGRLWRYVVGPATHWLDWEIERPPWGTNDGTQYFYGNGNRWGKSLWLDEDGNIWVYETKEKKLYIMPYCSWGRGGTDTVLDIESDGEFVLGDDSFYVKNGSLISSYNRKTYEKEWTADTGYNIRRFYWRSENHQLIAVAPSSIIVINTEDLQMNTIHENYYDVTIDKDGNYVFFNGSSMIFKEPELFHTIREIELPQSFSSPRIAANAHGDIAVWGKGGAVCPPIYLADFNYEKYVGISDIAHHGSMSGPIHAIGHTPNFLIAPETGAEELWVTDIHSNSLHTFPVDWNSMFYRKQRAESRHTPDPDFPDYPDNLWRESKVIWLGSYWHYSTDFLLAKAWYTTAYRWIRYMEGDPTFSQWTVWGRKWKPNYNAILAYLFGGGF